MLKYVRFNQITIKIRSDKMIQLDQLKLDLPAVKANLKEAGESL